MNIVVEAPSKYNSKHLEQFYTGLELLDHQGLIRLEYMSVKTEAQDYGYEITVRVNGQKVFIDCADSAELNMQAYEEAKWYFKRSYQPDIADELGHVHPYGLNYEVHPSILLMSTLKRHWLKPSRSPILRLKALVTTLDTRNIISWKPRQYCFDQGIERALSSEPLMIFYVRLWHPSWDAEHEMGEAEYEDRQKINRFRIQCVRLLKKQFGDQFVGGIIQDAYSEQQAPDLLAKSGSNRKQQYLDTVKQIPVCIASTGLHGSIGWKFAEYVAMGRAILTEPIGFQVPGPFANGQNYLEYLSPEHCVEQAVSLFENPERIRDIMNCNLEYYRQYLAPDQLVWNLLQKVIAGDQQL